jgi:hypothetical protein
VVDEKTLVIRSGGKRKREDGERKGASTSGLRGGQPKSS